jgi:hypothetical protein
VTCTSRDRAAVVLGLIGLAGWRWRAWLWPYRIGGAVLEPTGARGGCEVGATRLLDTACALDRRQPAFRVDLPLEPGIES